jgi:hypothetical protein
MFSIAMIAWLIKIIVIPGAGSLLDRVLNHPLDNILSLQQKDQLNFMQALRKMRDEYGFSEIYKSFYKGFLYPFVSVAPAKLVVISFYYNFEDFIRTSFYLESWQSYLISAIGASCIDVMLTCPAENYRVKKIFGIIPEINFKHLYHGLFPLFIRSLLGNCLMFAGSSILFTYGFVSQTFTAALICCFLYQYLTIPVEAWKNNVMSDKEFKSIWHHLNSIFTLEKMTNGVGVKLIGTIIGAFIIGLMMTLNENIDDILGIVS